MTDHISHGTPLESYELTRGDHSWQRFTEQITESVAASQREWAAEEAADPVLRERRLRVVERAWNIMLSNEPEPWELMRWRIRLYCGHITETRQHITFDSPDHGRKAQDCSECDSKPMGIVAWEPIGPVGERPGTPPVHQRGRRISQAPKPDGVLFVEEVAAELRLNHKTVRRHISSGRLPAVKQGGRWFIRRSALDEFLRAKPRS